MNERTGIGLENEPAAPERSVPWSVRDTWIGFSIYVALLLGLGGLSLWMPRKSWPLAIWFLLYQPVQFLPVWVVLRSRRATWMDLGLQKASPNVLALGCGLVILSLCVNLVNNLIMQALGIQIQAERFSGILNGLDQPVVFLLTGVVIGPFLEEIVFRGFLFGGLRRWLTWRKAALLSSILFALCHLQVAALVPTFVLGLLFSYLYQKSKSIWPGIILHMLVNSFSICILLVVSKYAS